MFDADRLKETAKALIATMYVGVYADLHYGLDSYGLDSGRTLLLVFVKHFKPAFMRQFYTGSKSNFLAAYDELEEEVKKVGL